MCPCGWEAQPKTTGFQNSYAACHFEGASRPGHVAGGMAVRGSEGTEAHPPRRLAGNQAEPRSPGAHTSPSAPHGSVG